MDHTTEQLSNYACNLSYGDLSPQVVHQVKRTLVDTFGCALGAFSAEPSVIARRLASRISSATQSRLLGTGNNSAPDMAAFTNSVMIRYLDCNDSYFSPGGGHPSDMIPAVLAMADSFGCDGPTVITAIALAYEVFCRLSDQVDIAELGWDQGMFTVIGAACGAGKVMGLDRQAMAHALSLSIVPNLPIRATRVGELSMWKGCATACTTRAGIFAAQLAQEGITGPNAPFDGRHGLWEQAIGCPVRLKALGGGGESFRITATSFKFFPSQIHTQGPIGLALELRNQVSVENIKTIRVCTYGTAVRLAATDPQKWHPRTRETADHSIPFLVATALHDGIVSPASFSAEMIGRPVLHNLIAKMTVEEAPDFTQRYPDQLNCRIEVESMSGQRFVSETAYPKGHHENPLSDRDLEMKFGNLTTGILSESRCRMALSRLWSIEKSASLHPILDSLIVV